jgi:uncharacterized protein (TIGR00725 family)
MKRKIIIGVIGASRPSVEGLRIAEAVGTEIARSGAVLVCGGLAGVMTAAAKGCAEAGGEVLGVLPGPDKSEANPYVTIAVPTNMGHARNIVIAHTADVLIAVEGEYGTISEAAISLKLGKRVVGLPGAPEIDGMIAADSAEDAVAIACEGLSF